MSGAQTARHWAILVGINDYNGKAGSLRGCINDVNKVEALLKAQLGHLPTSSVKIEKITSPNAAGGQAQNLPTLANIRRALDNVKNNAASGDFFYFHFSGHGGRQRGRAPQAHPGAPSKRARIQEVLVLCGKKNLKDYVLGRDLDDIASKGVRVFAVLDNCHSGGAHRNDGTSIRQVDEIFPPDETDSEEDFYSAEEEVEDSNTMSDSDGLRDGSMAYTYWHRARDYTVLAACYPHQFAKEGSYDGNNRQGALTYTMIKSIQALCSSGGSPTYQMLHNDINCNIHTLASAQDPMLFGRRDFRLFNDTTSQSVRQGAIESIDHKLGQLCINMGEAHGVQNGEVYTVYPRGVHVQPQSIATVKVKSIGATHAYTDIPKPVSGSKLEVGCRVELTTPVVSTQLRVGVESPELLGELTGLQRSPRSNFQFCDSKSTGLRYTVLSTDSHYQIVDASNDPVKNCAPFAKGADVALSINSFVQLLAHYNMMLQLQNRKSQLGRQFVFRERDNLTEVFDGDDIHLVVDSVLKGPKKRTQDRLYVSVLNLRPYWTTALMVPNPDDSLESVGIEHGIPYTDDPITMSIPNETDAEVVDIFIAIVTTNPTQFHQLDTTGSLRGSEDSTFSLEDLLTGSGDMLGPDRDGGRGKARGPDLGDWQTAKIAIKTKRRQQ